MRFRRRQPRGIQLDRGIDRTAAPRPNSVLCDWNAATGALSLVGGPCHREASRAVSIAPPVSWQRLAAPGLRRRLADLLQRRRRRCGVCVRINGATTQMVSETGTFWFATSDGSLAYVTDGGELKRYDVAPTN